MTIDTEAAVEVSSPPAQQGNSWRSSRLQMRVMIVILAVVLAILVLPPLYFLFQGSLLVTSSDGRMRLGLDYFGELIQQRGFFESALNSFVFALGSAIAALAIGGVNAWIAERTNAPLRPLAYLTTIISLGTPYVLFTSAWLLLLNKSGPINSLWRDLTGSTGVLINVYSMFGMILVEGLLWSPFAFLLLGASLRNSNVDFEEAARMAGADMPAIVRRIVLPLAMPALLALAMLVFIRALEAFEVPALVGMPGRVHVLTTDIYDAMHLSMPPNTGQASALAVILLSVVAVLLYFYERLLKNAERYATITGKGFRPRPLDLGPWRFLASGVLILNFVFVLVLPTSILVWASFLPFYQTFKWSALELLTLRNYVAVFNGPRYVGLVTNTLLVSIAAATIVMALTSLNAWLTVRRAPGSRVLDQLASVPLVFPGLVLALGVMQFFLQLPPIGVYGTIYILMWAFVINYLPYGTRYSVSGMLQIHRELEEAASMSGATALTTFRRIVVPLLAPSIVAGWLFIFLLSSRALSVPILLSGPSSQTMAVAMFDLWANGQGPELAALGILWSLGMTVIAVVFYILANKSHSVSRGA